MKREYDLSKAQKNPYAKYFTAGTVILNSEVLEFFKDLSEEKGVYHGELISDALKDILPILRDGKGLNT